MTNTIKIKHAGHELLVDSRIIAEKLGVDHKATIQVIDKYSSQIARFGTLPFQMAKSKGQPTRFALLNRSQAEFLLTLTRNTPEAIELKVQLIKAFDQARDALEASGNYIPFYHAAHDSLQTLVDKSGSSTPANIHHMNLEKLINATFCIRPGTRHHQTAEVRLMVGLAMAMANRVYQQALQEGFDHKKAYQAVKGKLKQLSTGFNGLEVSA
ncbi:Rha family transcriptional regulator [Neptunomonas qingdaonensis]|uniref:Phage regulatory protein Rha n=1 Tax=Neptunomonas qingdaonensis TaxID=1045558 RepID=A0A1I2N2F9_9GAMM|nr:Rha family transcriptional regulator [Neptunomonas qingdaonensis]SFF97833.1 Phage regulatory protein Rha [Neptunomonas qingdaonensis]